MTVDLKRVWGPNPGVETPVTPDEAVVVDAGDVVEGLGVGGWHSVVG
jgi:hypothetical protein